MTKLIAKKIILKSAQALALLSCLLLPVPSFAELDSFRAVLLQKFPGYRQADKFIIGNRELYAPLFVRGVYPLNDYQPLWDVDNRRALFAAIETLSGDGLTPQEYVLPEVNDYLEREQRAPLNATQRLELDLLLSEGLMRALYNLAYGKVDPVSLDSNINFTRPLAEADHAPVLLKYIRNGEILDLFGKVRPRQSMYVALQAGLAQYRLIEAMGGWGEIPDGKTLKPGETDARVPLLRDRLLRTGEQPKESASSDSEYFDEPLESALKSFQGRHGLEADGVVGAKTLAALNVSVANRIDQIRVNLERLRWYLHALEGEFIVVDIAGFKAYWVKNNDIVWEENVQVGTDYTRTPVFKAKIEYLEFNPTWTIPPGIINRSIRPSLKKDPGYLEKKGYELFSPDGQRVDAQTVDWSGIKGFPFVVRQPPGPDNAMGQVKFMFPNPHFVFLHDTNQRQLFDRTHRTFSAGCIRVRNPLSLAGKLLAGQGGWDRRKIDQVISSGKTTRVNLDQPVRIIIGYTTAFAVGGQVQFKQDIYNRDPAVLKGLDGEFTLRQQDLPRDSGE